SPSRPRPPPSHAPPPRPPLPPPAAPPPPPPRPLGAQDPQWPLPPLARREALLVPESHGPPHGPPAVVEVAGLQSGEQPAGVLHQQPVIPLGRDDHVLVPVPAEIDERRIEVQRVDDHHVEEPRVIDEDPLEQPLGGRLFPFAGAEQLGIQDQGQILADQLADRRLVIVFGDRLLLDHDGAGLAGGAAALAAGEELMAIDGREIVALAVGQRLVPLEAMGDVAKESPERSAVHPGTGAADGVEPGGPAPTRPRSRAGMRRSCSRPLRLPRRVAKRVKAAAKAAAVLMRGWVRESVKVGSRSPSPKTLSA